MLHGVGWLADKYSALSKGSAANSSLIQAIETFTQRLAAASKAENPLQERRAAILSLKGLAKDHPLQVATHAGKGLVECLTKDVGAAPADSAHDDVAKSLIDCLVLVCTPPEQPQHRKGQHQHRQAHVPAAPALDLLLETSAPLHALLPLLAPGRTFYLRFSSLQLLALVLRHRKQLVQAHVLTSPGGCGAILECLSTTSPTTGHSLGSSAEIIRNEALLLLPHLVDSNADIQKLIAFEGAFEKLLDVVAQEGRVEGGVVVQDALEALEALLRYNVSNQNYFRETLSIPLLAPLLFYPPPLPPNAPPSLATQRNEELERFAFQPWEYDGTDEFGQEEGQDAAAADGKEGASKGPNVVGDSQKLINAQLVVGIAGLLVQGTGEGKRANQNALLSTGFFNALLDLALGSSAPLSLKTQSLHVLSLLLKQSRNVQDALGEASVHPVEPIKTQVAADMTALPASAEGGDSEKATLAATPAGAPAQGIIEYARLPPQSALVALINAALNGIPPPLRPIDGGYRSLLGFRAAAIKALQSILSDNIDARLFVVASMAHSDETRPEDQPGAVLLEALTILPTNGQAEGFDEFRNLFASIILGTVLKGAESVKDLARRLRYAPDGKVVLLPAEEEGVKPSRDGDDDDEAASLLSLLIGNITLSLRSQSEAVRLERSQSSSSPTKGPTSVSWTRILLSHLTLLALWLHSSPKSVADLVGDSSNLQAIVQLVAEGANGEHLLVGMGTWVLGTIYEWGPEPSADGKHKKAGEGDSEMITRQEIHDLVTSRIGADQFQARLDRLRDDPRLKLVGPDVLDKVAHRNSIDPIHAALVKGDAGQGQQESIMAHLGLRNKDNNAVATGSTAMPAAPADEDTPASAAASSDLYFDWSFAEVYRHESSTIAQSILVPPTTTSAQASSSPAELVDAQRRIEQLTDQGKALQHEVETRGRLVTETLKEVEELRTKVAELEEKGKGGEAELEKLRGDHSSELEKLRNEHTTQLTGAEESHRSELENVRAAATRQGEGDSSALAAAREQVVALEAALEKMKAETAEKETSGKAAQDEESAKLRQQLEEASKKHEAERKDLQEQVEALKRQVEEQKAAAATAVDKERSSETNPAAKDDSASSSARVSELEQENQDLLVMLDELSTKRKKDKAALKEKGVEVSDDEDDDEDEDE